MAVQQSLPRRHNYTTTGRLEGGGEGGASVGSGVPECAHRGVRGKTNKRRIKNCVDFCIKYIKELRPQSCISRLNSTTTVEPQTKADAKVFCLLEA